MNVWKMNYRFHLMHFIEHFFFQSYALGSWARSRTPNPIGAHTDTLTARRAPHNYMINRTESERKKKNSAIKNNCGENYSEPSTWQIHNESIIFNQLANESEWIPTNFSWSLSFTFPVVASRWFFFQNALVSHIQNQLKNIEVYLMHRIYHLFFCAVLFVVFLTQMNYGIDTHVNIDFPPLSPCDASSFRRSHSSNTLNRCASSKLSASVWYSQCYELFAGEHKKWRKTGNNGTQHSEEMHITIIVFFFSFLLLLFWIIRQTSERERERGSERNTFIIKHRQNKCVYISEARITHTTVQISAFECRPDNCISCERRRTRRTHRLTAHNARVWMVCGGNARKSTNTHERERELLEKVENLWFFK